VPPSLGAETTTNVARLNASLNDVRPTACAAVLASTGYEVDFRTSDSTASSIMSEAVIGAISFIVIIAMVGIFYVMFLSAKQPSSGKASRRISPVTSPDALGSPPTPPESGNTKSTAEPPSPPQNPDAARGTLSNPNYERAGAAAADVPTYDFATPGPRGRPAPSPDYAVISPAADTAVSAAATPSDVDVDTLVGMKRPPPPRMQTPYRPTFPPAHKAVDGGTTNMIDPLDVTTRDLGSMKDVAVAMGDGSPVAVPADETAA